MRYLLDVNVLVAAIWTGHQHHAVADAWLAGKDLATCPLTELGYLRISTHPKILKSDMATARRLLDGFIKTHQPRFIPADLPALQSSATKTDHVTDQYLADLAQSQGFKLATLDSGISHPAVEVIN